MKKIYTSILAALCVFGASAGSLQPTTPATVTEIQLQPSAGLTPAPIRDFQLEPRQLSEVKTPTSVTPSTKAAKKKLTSASKDFSTVQGLCGVYKYSYLDYFDDANNTTQITISAVEGEENTVQIDGLFESFSVKATLDAAAGTLTIPRQNVATSVEAVAGTLSGTTITFLSNFVGTLDANAGTITFPAEQYFGFRPTDTSGFYALNSNNVFTALDEGNLLSISAEQCRPDNKFVFDITAGNNIASATAIIMAGTYPASEQNLNYVSANGQAITGSQFAWTPTTATPGVYTIMVAGLDKDGNVLSGDVCFVYYNDYSNTNWKAVDGKAVYGEDYVYTLYQSPSDDYEVTIEENTANPGFYRLVNPYSAPWPYASYNSHSTDDHNHYLYIHAEDPEKCYISSSCLGIDLSSDLGVIVATSYVQYSKDNEKDESAYAQYYGTLDTETGTITFPVKSLLQFGLGDKTGMLYYGNSNNKFKVVLPKDLLSGVNDIIADDENAPVEYFNLQGIKVENPAQGQIVIRRQGSKVSKVYVK